MSSPPSSLKSASRSRVAGTEDGGAASAANEPIEIVELTDDASTLASVSSITLSTKPWDINPMKSAEELIAGYTRTLQYPEHGAVISDFAKKSLAIFAEYYCESKRILTKDEGAVPPSSSVSVKLNLQATDRAKKSAAF